MSIEEVTNKFEKIHNTIRFQAFGKLSIWNKREKERTQNEGNEDETDKAKARKIFEQQEKIVAEVLKKKILKQSLEKQ